jgi:hypothetical protein
MPGKTSLTAKIVWGGKHLARLGFGRRSPFGIIPVKHVVKFLGSLAEPRILPFD